MGFGVTTLSDNSTVVTGCFKDSATFGQGEPGETILVSDGGSDVFVARYGTSGAVIWAKKAGGTGYNVGRSISTRTDGSLILTGHFGHTVVFGYGETGETALVCNGWSDIFTAGYDSDGSLLWADGTGGTQEDMGYSITAIQDNSFAITGLFNGSVTFGPGEPAQTVLNSAGWSDIFVARCLY